MDMYSFKDVEKEQEKKCEERAGEEVGCGGMRTLTWICIVSKM